MEQVNQPTDSQQKIRNHLTATQIEDHHTDVGVFQFEDKLFIVLTQFEKIGTLVLVTPTKRMSGASNPVYHIKVLFGKDEVEIHAFARFLAAKLNLSQPLLLGLAFKETIISAPAVQKVVSKVLDAIQKTNLSMKN